MPGCAGVYRGNPVPTRSRGGNGKRQQETEQRGAKAPRRENTCCAAPCRAVPCRQSRCQATRRQHTGGAVCWRGAACWGSAPGEGPEVPQPLPLRRVRWHRRGEVVTGAFAFPGAGKRRAGRGEALCQPPALTLPEGDGDSRVGEGRAKAPRSRGPCSRGSAERRRCRRDAAGEGSQPRQNRSWVFTGVRWQPPMAPGTAAGDVRHAPDVRKADSTVCQTVK